MVFLRRVELGQWRNLGHNRILVLRLRRQLGPARAFLLLGVVVKDDRAILRALVRALAVGCVRLDANGFLVPGSDVLLAGFPGAGAFMSSVLDAVNNVVIVVYIDPQQGIRLVRVNPATCLLSGVHVTVRPADTYLTSPPVVE